jgi:hypothetical protein
MTIDDRIKQCADLTESFIAAHPECTGLWWEILDVPIEDLKRLQPHEEMDVGSYDKRLRVCLNIGHATIFVKSRPVKTRIKYEFEGGNP